MEAEPEPIKLSSADLKLVSQGDDLSRPDVIHLGDATDDSGSRELTQDDIDARFRAKEEAILGCISRARPDEETYVPGRVTVKFRIQRTGNVRGVRVEAPAILQKGGIYGCIKGVVGGHPVSAVERQPDRVLPVLAHLTRERKSTIAFAASSADMSGLPIVTSAGGARACRAAAGRRRAPRRGSTRRRRAFAPAPRRGPCSCGRSVRRAPSPAPRSRPCRRRGGRASRRGGRRAGTASPRRGRARSPPPPATRRRRGGGASGRDRGPARHDRQPSTTSAARARSCSVSISRQPPSMNTGAAARRAPRSR